MKLLSFNNSVIYLLLFLLVALSCSSSKFASNHIPRSAYGNKQHVSINNSKKHSVKRSNESGQYNAVKATAVSSVVKSSIKPATVKDGLKSESVSSPNFVSAKAEKVKSRVQRKIVNGNKRLSKRMTPAPPSTGGTPGWGIASLVLGVLSLFLPFIGLLFGILAIIFAAISMGRGEPLKGLAIAGLVTGIVGAILGLVVILAWLLWASVVF